MTDDLKLAILKHDLQISTDKLNVYLETLLTSARSLVSHEGITVDDSSTEDGMLVVMYAAYLYRRRAETDTSMPRMLRYSLNTRRLSEQMGGGAGG